MIRVLKPGGEIRLFPVFWGEKYANQRVLAKELKNILNDLEKQIGIRVEKIRTSYADTYEYKNHEKVELLAEAYLVIIYKSKKYGEIAVEGEEFI